MGKSTKIEWSDATWNPVRGCTKISQGCKNCYAEAFAERWRGIKGHPFENGFDLTLVYHKLYEPQKWKDPKRIFVNSLSDLFHEDIPFDFIDKVFDVMRSTPRHTFQILTKRPEVMERYLSQDKIEYMPNVWLGVSVESQQYIDRIKILQKINKVPVRFISMEPMLSRFEYLPLENIQWVIVGGESGKKARPIQSSDWVREIKRTCNATNVAFFFKQWGEWIPKDQVNFVEGYQKWEPNEDLIHLGTKKTGRMLDGNLYSDMPNGYVLVAVGTPEETKYQLVKQEDKPPTTLFEVLGELPDENEDAHLKSIIKTEA